MTTRATKGTKGKRSGSGLEMKSFPSVRGNKTFLVFRTSSGAYHAFEEVEAKDAAKRCGATNKGNTRDMWKKLWG
jgi:hypothetical protein